MSKILITGATASQGSVDANNRTDRFSGLLNRALNAADIDSQIMFTKSTVSKDFYDQYDLVLVGIAPVNSMSAYRVYDALATVNALKDSGKLRIIIDAPEPSIIFQSFKSALLNPDILKKNHFANRSSYDRIISDSKFFAETLDSVEYLLSSPLDIITPKVPTVDATKFDYGIPNHDGGTLTQINVDSMLSTFYLSEVEVDRKFWVAEYPNQKWASTMAKTLTKPVLSIKRSAYDDKTSLVSRLHHSVGYLLNVYKNDLPWWSSNIMLSLSCGVPVFSDWRWTQHIGKSWTDLPAHNELIGSKERLALAINQKEEYLSHCQSLDAIAIDVAEKISV